MRRGHDNQLMEANPNNRSGGKRKMMEEQNEEQHEQGGDGLPPFKRTRQGEGPSTEMRVLLKSNASGAIIGKSGTNIKRLRETFKASVSIPDCSGPERIWTITADLGTCLEILRDSLPRTVETPPEVRGAQELEVRLLIHQSQAGGVIGKSGQRIKEIRENTNAQIKVFAQCCPLSTDRVVQISGDIEQIADSVNQVMVIAHQAGIKGTSQPYDPFNFDEFNAVEYGGYGGGGGSGGGGGNYGGGRGGMGDGMGMSWNDGGRGGMRGGGMRGGRGGHGGGGGMLPNRGMLPRGGMNRGGDRSGFDSPQYRNSGNGPPMTDPVFSGQPNTANSKGEQATQQVSIPKDLAGAIIGPQGTRIRAIRAQSGAQIIIGKAESAETEERVISINGTEDQIQNAQYLMQMAVRQHSGKF